MFDTVMCTHNGRSLRVNSKLQVLKIIPGNESVLTNLVRGTSNLTLVYQSSRMVLNGNIVFDNRLGLVYCFCEDSYSFTVSKVPMEGPWTLFPV